jgi:hypothetical protein
MIGEELVRTLVRNMDWKPIETAPKDGTWVLLCKPDNGKRNQCRVREGKFIYNDDDDPCWRVNFGFWPFDRPTHWMLMPKPPEENT